VHDVILAKCQLRVKISGGYSDLSVNCNRYRILDLGLMDLKLDGGLYGGRLGMNLLGFAETIEKCFLLIFIELMCMILPVIRQHIHLLACKVFKPPEILRGRKTH